MSDSLDPREFLAAAPIDAPDLDDIRLPLALLPCLAPRYDRNGFPTFPGRRDGP
jgi:hypothetical protein